MITFSNDWFCMKKKQAISTHVQMEVSKADRCILSDKPPPLYAHMFNLPTCWHNASLLNTTSSRYNGWQFCLNKHLRDRASVAETHIYSLKLPADQHVDKRWIHYHSRTYKAAFEQVTFPFQGRPVQKFSINHFQAGVTELSTISVNLLLLLKVNFFNLQKVM